MLSRLLFTAFFTRIRIQTGECTAYSFRCACLSMQQRACSAARTNWCERETGDSESKYTCVRERYQIFYSAVIVIVRLFPSFVIHSNSNHPILHSPCKNRMRGNDSWQIIKFSIGKVQIWVNSGVCIEGLSHRAIDAVNRFDKIDTLLIIIIIPYKCKWMRGKGA